MTTSLWQRLGCCLRGHDYSVKSNGTRMFLQCKDCGHASRGLEISEDPLHRRARLNCAKAGGNPSAARRTHLAA